MDIQPISAGLNTNINSRRTFSIISHPDAGKTTLTEKLLLYSGMIRTAGMVRGRKNQKHASSDWMKMEQERGISITASAMQFNYKDCVINVLDTTGHQDFSEDTYRTLTASDCSVMVIDAAKGVETQTRKLFAVCRMRGIPILTFVNKMDMPGREPLDLLHEVEEVLGIKAAPVNWPIGSGKTFRGVIDLQTNNVMLFERGGIGGSTQAVMQSVPHTDPRLTSLMTKDEQEQLDFDLSLLEEAGNKFSKEAFLKGELTPVFFGSALTNFGVEPFFDAFVDLAPPPRARKGFKKDNSEIMVNPVSEEFSAYVFKIQANMDLRHRDSMAFLRVVSGKFERDLEVYHSRLGKKIRINRSLGLLAGSRETVDIAYAGDVLGVINPGTFEIGDTVSTVGGYVFEPMPQFPPEVVARLRPKDISSRKAFDKGMKQIASEGAVQVLTPKGNMSQDPLIAAVGKLQFDVVQFRLKHEYNVDTQLDILPYSTGAWLEGDASTYQCTSTSMLATNSRGLPIVLFQSEWEKRFSAEKNPQHKLVDFGSATA